MKKFVGLHSTIAANVVMWNAYDGVETLARIPRHPVVACTGLDGGDDCLRNHLVQIGLDLLGHVGHLAELDEVDSCRPERN